MVRGPVETQARSGHCQLPDAVGALARDFWRLAVDAAGDALATEREQLAADKAESEKLIDLAQEDTVAAVEIATHLKHQLALRPRNRPPA